MSLNRAATCPSLVTATPSNQPTRGIFPSLFRSSSLPRESAWSHRRAQHLGQCRKTAPKENSDICRSPRRWPGFQCSWMCLFRRARPLTLRCNSRARTNDGVATIHFDFQRVAAAFWRISRRISQNVILILFCRDLLHSASRSLVLVMTNPPVPEPSDKTPVDCRRTVKKGRDNNSVAAGSSDSGGGNAWRSRIGWSRPYRFLRWADEAFRRRLAYHQPERMLRAAETMRRSA